MYEIIIKCKFGFLSTASTLLALRHPIQCAFYFCFCTQDSISLSPIPFFILKGSLEKGKWFNIWTSGTVWATRWGVALAVFSNINGFRDFLRSSLILILHMHTKLAFNNYVGNILSFFDHPPTSRWTCLTLNVDKNGHFLTTYPSHLVYVVFERPPSLGSVHKLRWQEEVGR